jgi:hypothetical protein
MLNNPIGCLCKDRFEHTVERKRMFRSGRQVGRVLHLNTDVMKAIMSFPSQQATKQKTYREKE